MILKKCVYGKCNDDDDQDRAEQKHQNYVRRILQRSVDVAVGELFNGKSNYVD